MLPPAAADLLLAQRRRIALANLLAGREWDSIGDDFDTGWARVGPRLVVIVGSAQMGAASTGAAFVPAVLAQQGQSVTADALVRPAGFAGAASDGRPLLSLLYGAVVHSRVADVGSLPERLAVGRTYLETLVRTQVEDAARDATAAAMTARPGVRWVRIVNPGSCQRCAVLAGRVYRYSQDFKRHPRCRCSMLPETVANPDATGVVIGPGDVRDLTKLQRQAIADGADFNKVINDYNRKGAWHLPPTRVDEITARATSRRSAVEALTQAGYLAA